MGEFKVIESQEQLDAIIQDRVAQANRSAEKKYEGYISPADFETKTADLNSQISALQKSIDDEKAKYADYDQKIAEKDAAIKAYEIASVKTRIAREKGLSYEAIEFLQGEKEEDIKKSAETLKALVGTGKKTQPLANFESGSGESSERAALRGMLADLK